jgi:hypothetical protein
LAKPFADNIFAREFKKGYEYQMLIALKLLRKGFVIESSTDSIAPSYEERKKYSDNYDLLVSSKGWDKKKAHHLEVVSRNLTFNTPNDFPFEDIFVCSVHDWKKDRNADYFVIVSQITKGPICVPTKSFPEWTTRRIRDSVRGTNETVYCAPKSCFISFEEMIELIG